MNDDRIREIQHLRDHLADLLQHTRINIDYPGDETIRALVDGRVYLCTAGSDDDDYVFVPQFPQCDANVRVPFMED